MEARVAVTTITDTHRGANQLFLRKRGGYIQRTYDTRVTAHAPEGALDLGQLETAEREQANREGREPDLRIEHLGESLASGTVLFRTLESHANGDAIAPGRS